MTDTFKVLEKCCDHCLFSKNALVHDERKAEILNGCAEKGTYFECHRITSHRGDVLYDDKFGDDHAAAAAAAGEVEGCCHAFFKLNGAPDDLKDLPVEYVPVPDIDPGDYIFLESHNRPVR